MRGREPRETQTLRGQVTRKIPPATVMVAMKEAIASFETLSEALGAMFDRECFLLPLELMIPVM